MAPRRNNQRRRNFRRSRPQVFRENGATQIKSMESYSVGVNGIEAPADRSYRAISLTLHLVASGPILCNAELFAPGNRVAWRSAPISVGVIPVRRTFRWPTSAAAMWPSSSADTLFKLVCPCAGRNFKDSVVSVNYVLTVHLSADYDAQVCPVKSHGVIEPLVLAT